MKTGKLDKRHNGHKSFKYHVRFNIHELEKYVEVRNWLWETYGPSAELEVVRDTNMNVKWSWVYDQYNIKCFLASDKEYQWFVLKWG